MFRSKLQMFWLRELVWGKHANHLDAREIIQTLSEILVNVYRPVANARNPRF